MGDPVFIPDFPTGKKWISGNVGVAEGPRSFRVTLSDGHTVRQNIDHICFVHALPFLMNLWLLMI